MWFEYVVQDGEHWISGRFSTLDRGSAETRAQNIYESYGGVVEDITSMDLIQLNVECSTLLNERLDHNIGPHGVRK